MGAPRSARRRRRWVFAALALVAAVVIAPPVVWAFPLVAPYAGAAPIGRCTAEDRTAVAAILRRYDLEQAVATSLIRNDFYDADVPTIERHTNQAARTLWLTYIRSPAYLAASFCERAGASEARTRLTSIPAIAERLEPARFDRRFLATCIALEPINLAKPSAEIEAHCAHRSRLWDLRADRRRARRT